MDAQLAPEQCHRPLLAVRPLLAFDPARDFHDWRRQLANRFTELLGVQPQRVPPDVRVEFERRHEATAAHPPFDEIRFLFRSEANADVPCHLLIPTEPGAGADRFPVVICLQGHSPGMHISLGRATTDAERELVEGDRDIALQAVARGYAALVLEQRCFGEREDRRDASVKYLNNRCHHASMTALLLGRTMAGERVWDVCRAIDVLAHFPRVDSSRVACTGNSGGGTITYFAACVEPRIRVAMPSCFVCSFAESLGAIDHCADNYVPGLLRYADCGDLAGLIAPRPLIVVAGRTDPIFPFTGVTSAYETIQNVYRGAGAPGQCRLVVGEGGHRFYCEAWNAFAALSGW